MGEYGKNGNLVRFLVLDLDYKLLSFTCIAEKAYL